MDTQALTQTPTRKEGPAIRRLPQHLHKRVRTQVSNKICILPQDQAMDNLPYARLGYQDSEVLARYLLILQWTTSPKHTHGTGTGPSLSGWWRWHWGREGELRQYYSTSTRHLRTCGVKWGGAKLSGVRVQRPGVGEELDTNFFEIEHPLQY